MAILEGSQTTVVGGLEQVDAFLGSGAPVDGTTGAGQCRKGALYIDAGTPDLYINAGTEASPVWKKITRAA